MEYWFGLEVISSEVWSANRYLEKDHAIPRDVMIIDNGCHGSRAMGKRGCPGVRVNPTTALLISFPYRLHLYLYT